MRNTNTFTRTTAEGGTNAIYHAAMRPEWAIHKHTGFQACFGRKVFLLVLIIFSL